MRRPESKGLARRPRKPAKESGLMKRLTSRAQLPAYIRRLPALPLSRLNDELGLEDSQEILALLGRDQMKAVLSVSLWRSPQPGQEEVLDLDQLIRWIDIWMQEGEETLTRGVLDLGEVFLVSCLAKLLTAPDRTTEGIEGTGLEIAQYVIFPLQERHWPRIVEMLTILWRHEPDFLRRVLGRRSFHRSVLKDDTTEDDGGEALYQDVAGERLAERAGRPRSEWLEAALSLLADEASESAARKMGELVFLANVLMSAVQLQGRAFRETKAVKVAMATANLGLSYLLQIPAETAASMDQAGQLLEEDPGVVRLFQNGYHLLSAIPR